MNDWKYVINKNEANERMIVSKSLSENYEIDIDYDYHCGSFYFGLDDRYGIVATCNFNHDEMYGWNISDYMNNEDSFDNFYFFNEIIETIVSYGIDEKTARNVAVCFYCLKMFVEYDYLDLDKIYDSIHEITNDETICNEVMETMEIIMHKIAWFRMDN